MEWVEGRIFGSLIQAADGKAFSLLELRRNLQAVITDAGGVKIAEGKIPSALLDAIYAEDDGVGVRYNAGRGDVRNQPVETWVIRRADSAIWIQVNGSEHSGNLLIAETRPVQITAGLLPAEALRQQLEADGRVAIEVNFAVDDAEILQDSRPQIDQVTTLLREDDALRLSIEGHTDDTGDPTHNERLSAARAQSVLSALVGRASRPDDWRRGAMVRRSLWTARHRKRAAPGTGGSTGAPGLSCRGQRYPSARHRALQSQATAPISGCGHPAERQARKSARRTRPALA